MESVKCPNCNASMIPTTGTDGSKKYKCQYCGSIITYQQSTSDKIIGLFNRLLTSRESTESDQEDKYLQILRDPNATEKEKKYANRELMRLAAIRRARR